MSDLEFFRRYVFPSTAGLDTTFVTFSFISLSFSGSITATATTDELHRPIPVFASLSRDTCPLVRGFRSRFYSKSHATAHYTLELRTGASGTSYTNHIISSPEAKRKTTWQSGDKEREIPTEHLLRGVVYRHISTRSGMGCSVVPASAGPGGGCDFLASYALLSFCQYLSS